jgi:uncharacterized protein YbaA (DUF1428 family)
MNYVDGYVFAVPKKNLDAYRRIASKAGKIWREHGALQYVETVGDDLDVKGCVPFKKLVKPKAGETIIFSWIVYKSRKDRDRINAKVMADPRLAKMMEQMQSRKTKIFDEKRMTMGGFKTLVEA